MFGREWVEPSEAWVIVNVLLDIVLVVFEICCLVVCSVVDCEVEPAVRGTAAPLSDMLDCKYTCSYLYEI